MYLKKIRFFDLSQDDFKVAIGKNLTEKSGKYIEAGGKESPRFRYKAPTYESNSENYFIKKQRVQYTQAEDMESFDTGGLRSYHYGDLVVPETRNLIAVNDDSKAVSSGRITAKFNFVSEQYEQYISNISETQIPCIYLESDPEQTQTLTDVKMFPRVIPKARHFYDFNYILKPKYKLPLPAKFQNVLFGQNFAFSPANSQREQYPFYNRVKFNFRTTNSFKNVLKQYNFFEQFIEDYISEASDFSSFVLETTQNQASSVNRLELRLYDLLNWIQKSDLTMNQENKVIFEPTLKPKTRYKYYLDKLAFIGKLRKFSKEKMPSIDDILNNKPVETETLFYRIDKSVDGVDSVIQSFWVPADDGFVDLVDTQVKYGVKYRYTVHAYVLAFGCQYQVSDKTTQGNKVNLDFQMIPSFKVIEVPNVYSDICRIIQPPQPVPTVQFVNEKNADDYLKIYLNLSLNSNNEPLRPIDERELQQEILRREYDRLEERDRFVYNNERALYEVYRTSFQPKKLTDLQGHRIASIRNSFPSTGVSHTDYVVPFTKYYYVFRSVNFHGLVSNPTPIYEVELTKDADETFLSAKSVGFLKDNTSQTTRRFIKLMQAIPASQHTVFDNEANGLLDEEGNERTTLRGLAINNLSLGVAEKPIWGKKFKFRITSTTTGKKIDVNIMVNLIKKKTMENSK